MSEMETTQSTSLIASVQEVNEKKHINYLPHRLHSKSCHHYALYPAYCYSIPQAQKGILRAPLVEGEIWAYHNFYTVLPSATSSKVCSFLQWCWAPAGWKPWCWTVAILWVLSSSFSVFWEREECSRTVPGWLSWAYWRSLGAVGRSCNVRNSALRVVVSPSVQSEPEMGEGPVKKS